ncbi:RNA exonuclease 4 [Sceloporus undulatus]|uniref:RNA exonuclease 4 n=1 Tax=Sceloporus undulatus TaxID=8520 RepID=UPI001C4A94F4|nr:RNA exonuclease 4 [Sceloporus undulatus]XP_042333856.1 RNA exonuclease 4 [Sceloporus undulatus]XP_042333857.1 RNA exonuclease 4 [Sceloporus undulatus]XP_042333858.1 RNA exonuclease 4 [Sceloporus undulatus]
MGKIRPKETQTPSDNSAAKLENHGKQHRKKRKLKKKLKKKIKEVEKKLQKDSKPTAELPPKTPQEVSANWKALQELLRQNAAVLNSTAPNESSKKRNGTRAGGIVSQVKGTGTVLTPKPTEKAQKIWADILTQPGQTKSENNIHRKNMPLAQGNRKERKGGKRRASDEKEHRAVKQKWREEEEPGEAQPADIWFDDVDPDDIEAALGPEAAKVARKNLGIREKRPEQLLGQVLEKERAFEGLTKAVAMDCEMVGVGPEGEESIVARVSIVNLFGKCIYDKYIKPTEKVTDYRTAVSGIRPEHLKAGEDFKVVQKEVASILRGRILVGHALHNDLKILFLDHPKKKTRDTQRYKPFKQQVKSGRPSLKLLCEKLLNVRVQTSEHSSIEDAQAAMRLYTMVKKDWEASLKENSKTKKE